MKALRIAQVFQRDAAMRFLKLLNDRTKQGRRSLHDSPAQTSRSEKERKESSGFKAEFLHKRNPAFYIAVFSISARFLSSLKNFADLIEGRFPGRRPGWTS